jgi:hypothetical protein
MDIDDFEKILLEMSPENRIQTLQKIVIIES